MERLLHTARSEMAQSIQTELQSIDRKQWRIANRLGAVQILSQEFAEPPAVAAATRLWQWTVTDRPSVRCIATGAGTPLVLHYRPVEASRLSSGLWSAAVALLVTGIALLAWRLNVLRAVFVRWPLAWAAGRAAW